MKSKVKLTKLFLPLVVGALLLFGVLSVLAANQTVPLKGKFSGAGSSFSGQVTQLGQFDGVFDPETYSAVWVAANGDTLINQTTSFVFVDPNCPQDSQISDWCEYVQELTINGGTGRFAFARGQATVTGFMDPGASGAYNGRIDGTLTWQIPDDEELAARISAPSHPLDIDGDGVEELFAFDVAVTGEDDGGALGSVQWRRNNLVTNFAINNGDLYCDREYDRPVIRLNSTATSWASGNNDEGQEVRRGVSLNISPINPQSAFDYDLRWTIYFTDPELTASSAIYLPIVNTIVTTDPWPINGFLNIDPCLVIPGPD